MQRSSAALCAAAALLALGAGCSSPTPDPRVPRASTPSHGETADSSPGEVPEPSPTRPAGLGRAPEDLHDMDWAGAAVPGDFCDVRGLIRFRAGQAWAQSGKWGKVHAEDRPEAVAYGDLLGDSRDEAALLAGCDTGGETAGARLAWAYVVFTSEKGELRFVGTVTPQYVGRQAGAFDGIQLASGRVVAHEVWFRESDPDCCPSGRATTRWTLDDDGTLDPDSPHVTS
ncbi:hypothetical protein [Streptomyces sp. H51]|uniref:hypothetical protein n=1 Tax=Streptomyces sp. H51 TaxID=3111770 RepID=UPI002D78A710|nr:hypothetical protein [Streptomyces sp. H51]